jgi:glycosyltransferase involved in cell wall biosynthesis
LAGRIAELARDPELRARLGLAGKATAERRFDRSRLGKDVIPLYRRVSAQGAPDAAAQLAALR